jgi:hypothetical protein
VNLSIQASWIVSSNIMSELLEDVFWGRCAPASMSPVFNYDREPKWRDDGTCSHCGGMRPSIALKAIREGAEVEPTDKNYKIYLRGINVPGCPAGKCYLNHFSESQAVEFVVLNETGKMKLAYPGRFYSGLCFGIYKDAIEKALKELPVQTEPNADGKVKLIEPSRPLPDL